jgi:hypothetical protein
METNEKAGYPNKKRCEQDFTILKRTQESLKLGLTRYMRLRQVDTKKKVMRIRD